MSRFKSFGLTIAILPLCWLVAGCGDRPRAYVDRESVQAPASRPTSTEVKPISIPYNPELPVYILVVDRFDMAASGVTADAGSTNTTTVIPTTSFGAPPVIVSQGSGIPVIEPGSNTGAGVTAQLISQCQRDGNVQLIDLLTYQQRGYDEIKASLEKNERGPYLIRGAITEFAQKVDESSNGESSGPSMLWNFVPLVGWVGSNTQGSKSKVETNMIGMVGLVVQLVDPKSGRVKASFTSQGSFITSSMSTSRTVWGKTKTNNEKASSALGQATMMAMNDTAVKLHQKLEALEKLPLPTASTQPASQPASQPSSPTSRPTTNPS